ncbi:MAG: SH3 domain-containing protein [Blautia sp.]|nr:SH3 domain-containing protein [Blautia sp.]
MDDFREWLSDYLRYFILGGAILIVVLAIIFGLRACHGRKDKSTSGTNDTVVSDTSSTQVSSDTGDSGQENTSATVTAAAAQNPLVAADNAIVSLIRNYYEALSQKDVERMQNLVDDLLPSDEPQIKNSAFGNYVVGDIYTKNGLTEDAKVVYASYTYKVDGYDTVVPDVSWLYLIQGEDGSWKIDGDAQEDSRISAFVAKLSQDSDVAALLDKNRNAYQTALSGDAALSEYLNSLGETVDEGSASQTADTGTIMMVTSDCNVRSSPSTQDSSNIVGGLAAGDSVRKTGDAGEWVQISYDGETAYVHGSLLQEAGVGTATIIGDNEDGQNEPEENGAEEEAEEA